MEIADREEGCGVEDVWISGYWEKCLEEVGLGKNRNRNSELLENGKGKENDEMR